MPHVDIPQSTCRFAIARGDITPPVGIYHRMWGAATHDRATGVHRPLEAAVMAFGPLDRSETEQFIVSLDHCLFGPREMERVRRRASDVSGAPAEQTIYLFTHTHGAGLMDLGRSELPGGDLIAAYLDRLGTTVGELIAAAHVQMQPAAIVYGEGRCDLARQRHFWDAESNEYVCGFNPLGTTDDTVLVARVTTLDALPLATIVNYACHPTTLAWANTLISPDFPARCASWSRSTRGCRASLFKAPRATTDHGTASSPIRQLPTATAGSWATPCSRRSRRCRRRSCGSSIKARSFPARRWAPGITCRWTKRP